jgi:hypothetical protein
MVFFTFIYRSLLGDRTPSKILFIYEILVVFNVQCCAAFHVTSNTKRDKL